MSLKKQGKYRFNDFEVDLGQRSVRRAGHSISVSPRTFDLLAFFVLNPQRVVSKRELMDTLWPDSNVDENTLGQQVLLLRKALTGTQSGDKLVVTIPDRGYQFTASVTRVDLAKASGSDRREARLQPRPATSRVAFAVEEDEDEAEPSESVPDEALPSGAKTGDTTQFSKSGSVPKQTQVPKRSSAPEMDPDANSDSNPEFAPEKPVGLFAAMANSGPLFIVGVMALVAILVWGGWLGWRWYQIHRPQPDSLGLVIGPFTNNTGNPQFDASITTASTIDLRQSPFLRIADDREVFDAKIAEPKNNTAQVCRQLHDQAYLTGNIHRLGQKYLVALEATNCATGRSMARSIGIADSPEGVVLVLDKVAADLRRQLGESASSVANYNKPLFAGRTPSLESLKAYADASVQLETGNKREAVSLLQRAVELDPQFTLAFYDLGVASSTLGDEDMAETTLTRAYGLRDTASDFDKLSIIAAYDSLVRGDLIDGIRNQKDATEKYPNNAVFPAYLAQLYMDTGNPALALDPAQRSVALNPGNPDAYVTLARAYLRMNRFDEAAATCRRAIDLHLDGPQIHGFLLQIAYLHLDQPAIDEQVAWAHTIQDDRAESYMHLQQAFIAFADGKVAAARALFAKLVDDYRKRGESEQASRILDAEPRMSAEVGLLEAALAQLTHLPASSDPNPSVESADIPVAWAEVGETSRAQTLLQRLLDAHPTATLWQQELAPQIRASIDLNQRLPDAAIHALEAAAPYENRSFDVTALRGRAYLAAKQPDLAEREFHKILDHHGIDPLSYNYPLAQLGLARSLAQQGKSVEAEYAYSVLFQIWKDADPDLPRLKAAKEEYTHLTGLPAHTKPAAPSHPATKPTATRR
jgi:DNA-binding winged helix-turn-helix (wHTH) protein/tetratricopeptide (TPR) repeat protein